MNRDFIPGTRYFKCTACEIEWEDRTLDCMSPYGESCPECEELNYPYDYKVRLHLEEAS